MADTMFSIVPANNAMEAPESLWPAIVVRLQCSRASVVEV
jgi:hypothetical protein